MLEVRNLAVSYGRIRAVQGVDLDVRAGEIVALVGANGAGKTTLLNTISGLQRASEGAVLFEGADLKHSGAPPPARRRRRDRRR